MHKLAHYLMLVLRKKVAVVVVSLDRVGFQVFTCRYFFTVQDFPQLIVCIPSNNFTMIPYGSSKST